jgi:Na+-transporting NADH:ubiquinone oxidoreductase subunit NqrC
MKRKKNKTRDGLVLVCVIACLVVTSALVALAVQSALRGRREARLQLQLRQTELLCEAGVMRATTRLQASIKYAGEQWLPELNLDNYHDAVVEIEVSDVDETTSESSASSKKVTVIAKLDSFLDQDGPMQRTHNFIFQTQTPSTSPENQ